MPRILLSSEDLQVLAQLASGLPNSSAARALNMSERTLRRRVRDICERVGVGTPVEAIAWAARARLI